MVEGTALEMRRTGNGAVSSNLTISAMTHASVIGRGKLNASMAERSIATDCKSVVLWATQVRILLGAQNNKTNTKVFVLFYFAAEQDSN